MCIRDRCISFPDLCFKSFPSLYYVTQVHVNYWQKTCAEIDNCSRSTVELTSKLPRSQIYGPCMQLQWVAHCNCNECFINHCEQRSCKFNTVKHKYMSPLVLVWNFEMYTTKFRWTPTIWMMPCVEIIRTEMEDFQIVASVRAVITQCCFGRPSVT